MGKIVLSKMVEQMCQNAGIDMWSNHSLRTTAATEMFHANTRKLVQERTGHRSLTALRLYEHTTEAEHQVVSEVLAAKGGTAFHQVQKELANKEDLQLWSHSLQITHNHYISHHLCLQVLLLLTVILALVKVAS